MEKEGIILAGVLLFAASSAQAQPAAPAAKTAGEVLKNVHVLSDVPMSEWNDTMRFISDSLGVGCGHCHTGQAYEKDDFKPKETARKMIRMTREMDTNNFGGHRAVTCYTCHQGSTQPKQTPLLWNKSAEELAAIKQAQQKKAAATEASGGVSAPDAEQVLTKYLKAVGGDKVKTIHMKTDATSETGPPLAVEVDMAMPDKLLIQASTGNQKFQQILNGDHGWTIFQGRTMEMPPSNVGGLKKQINVFSPIKLPETVAPRKTSGLEKIGDRTFAVVESRTDSLLERLYFDVNTGLLYKIYNETQTVLGTIPGEIVFEDYRDVDGVKIPFQLITRTPTDRSHYAFSDFRIDKKMDSSLFEPPSPTAGGK
jgi:hypothetical protein